MASFKSIISWIGHNVLKVEQEVEPVVKVLLPASAPIFALLDPIVSRIQNAVVTVEANAPDGTAGSDKFAAVLNDFNAGLAVANSVLAAEGKQLVFDQASFTAATNAQVEALRQFAVLKASIRIVPLVAAPVVNQ